MNVPSSLGSVPRNPSGVCSPRNSERSCRYSCQRRSRIGRVFDAHRPQFDRRHQDPAGNGGLSDPEPIAPIPMPMPSRISAIKGKLHARTVSVARKVGEDRRQRDRLPDHQQEHREDRAGEPARAPSSMNGPRTNQFVAPTSFITSISRRREKIERRIVFAINKIDATSSTAVAIENTASMTCATWRMRCEICLPSFTVGNPGRFMWQDDRVVELVDILGSFWRHLRRRRAPGWRSALRRDPDSGAS